MTSCQSCGTALADNTQFCHSCGSSTNLRTDVPAAIESFPVAPVMSTSGETQSNSMDTNVVGALTYIAGFITGIVFLVLDPYKANSFVRFHALQSIFFNVAWIAFWILWMTVSAILTPLTAGLFGILALPVILLLSLGGFGIWLFLMYQAYQQKLYRLPLVGKFAAQYAGVRL